MAAPRKTASGLPQARSVLERRTQGMGRGRSPRQLGKRLLPGVLVSVVLQRADRGKQRLDRAVPMLGPFDPTSSATTRRITLEGGFVPIPRALIRFTDTLQVGLPVFGATSQLFLKQPGRVDLTVMVMLHARLLWEIHSTDQGDSAFPEGGR